jgi:hypothetical protein
MVTSVTNSSAVLPAADVSGPDVFGKMETRGAAAKSVLKRGSTARATVKGGMQPAIKSVTIVPDQRLQAPRGATRNGTIQVIGGNGRDVDPGMTRANKKLQQRLPSFTQSEPLFRPFGSPNFKVKIEYESTPLSTIVSEPTARGDTTAKRVTASSRATVAVSVTARADPLIQSGKLAGQPATVGKLPEGFEFNRDTGVLRIGGKFGRALGGIAQAEKTYTEQTPPLSKTPYELSLNFYGSQLRESNPKTLVIGPDNPTLRSDPLPTKEVAALSKLLKSGNVKSVAFEGSSLQVPVYPGLNGKIDFRPQK